MTLNDGQLQQRFADLRDLSAKKKYRLPKPERDECVDVLSLLLESSSENAERVVESLPGFPSDVGALVLTKMWQHLQTSEFPIIPTLQSEKFSSDLCKRLRLMLSHQLLSLSPDCSALILLDLFQDMKSAKKDYPTINDLKLISSTFLDKGYVLLNKLSFANAMESQAKLSIIYIVAAAFLAKSKGELICSHQAQLEILRWTKAFPKLGGIPTEVAKGITAAIREWSDDFRQILGNEVDTMHISIRNALLPVIETPATAVSLYNQLGPFDDSLKSADDQSKFQYDPLFEISRLVEHIKEQDLLLKDTLIDLEKSERDQQLAHSELRTVKNDREELKKELDNLKDKTNQLRMEQEQLEKSRNELAEDLRKARSDIKNAEDKLVETQHSYDQQLDSLSERIAGEGNHRIEAFKKKLMLKLRIYGQSLDEVEDMEMTVELGKVLQIQLKQILKILKSQGIEIEGIDNA